MQSDYTPERMVDAVRQSPPIDVSDPYDAAWVKEKVILVTGGASGFGAAFVRHWAQNGAFLIVGDINVEKGDAEVRDIRTATGNPNVHFLYCDVADWQSQVALFQEAVKLSPHGGLDTVVANAGIARSDPLQLGADLDKPNPPPPDLKTAEINIIGVLYTVHLAYFWLTRNPGSAACSPDSEPANATRDRHILLVGSIAAVAPVPILPQYCASKHAVLGLFRSLRSTSHPQGIRINLILPYFIDTPLITGFTRLALAGGAMGKIEDVVDAATRFVADSRILGRGLAIGPKVHVKQDEQTGEWNLVKEGEEGSVQRAVWECYAEDWEDTDVWGKSFIRIINGTQWARGWLGWFGDLVKAVGYGFRNKML